MEKIIITPFAAQKLDHLLEALIYKGYFSFIENALAYHNNIVDFMYTIPTRRRYKTLNKNMVNGTVSLNPTETLLGIFVSITMATFM